VSHHILVVEDDTALRRVLLDSFRHEGYSVDAADTVSAALRCADRQSPDLVILDLMLPDGDGFELCNQLRRHDRARVIMLTARSSKSDILRGLNSGADDYVSKPFDFDELLARARVVLGRGTREAHILILGDVTIDFDSVTALRKQRPIHITPRECQLLKYLASRPNRSVSRDELLAEIWHYVDAPITRLVDQAIARLRRKIEPDPSEPKFLRSVHGEGYCLVR